MPIIPSGTPLEAGSGQDVIPMITGKEQVRDCMGKIIDKYALDKKRGLGIPATLAQFDHESQQFVATKSEPRQINTAITNRQQAIVKAEEQKFLQALRDYEKNVKPRYKTGIHIDGTHTMAEVWKYLDSTVEKYEKGGEKPGVWGRVRRAFRGLGENGQAIDQWLGLLPTQSNYLSIVCGGFKLILGAAERVKDVRDAVLSGVHDIPVLLTGAQRVLGIYTSSQRLGNLSDALYMATLTSPSFQKNLSQSLDDMRKCRDDFNEEGRVCGIEMQGRIEILMQATNSNTEDIQGEIALTQRFMILTHNEQARTQQLLHEEAVALGKTMASMRTAQDEQLGLLNQVLEIMNGSPMLKNEELKLSRYAPEYGSRSSETHSSSEYSLGDLRRIILSRLDYDMKRIQVDVEENYSVGTTIPLGNQDRCVYAMTSVELASWINCPTSSLLVINGNMGNTQFRSPLSFISARLVYTIDLLRGRTLEGKDQIAALHFFCGEHADRGEQNELLSSFKRINLMDLIELGDFQSNDMEAVCRRFKHVLKLLPPTGIVFCIVDSLPFYLVDERTSEGARSLLRWLIKLTRWQTRAQEAGDGFTFKLLLTAAVQFIELEVSALDDDEVLNIPVAVPQTGGFTDMKWKMGVETEVNRLT
ncbi:hypothetical protein BDW59DRAFT_169699 [Aspergillus cavernicola]|uniref:Uncharacterized protein n=1 Tax=Aspergillus cavernicola TaxID=176166 RepID=A0ABR4IX90_9EURO